MFLVTLLVALPLSVALRGMIESHLGSSLEAGTRRDRDQLDWWQEFSGQAVGLATTFVPSVIGFGAVLDNLSGFFDNVPVAATVSGATLAWLVIWSFLSGGVLDRLARNRPTRTAGFFAACGTHFWRFLRLGLLGWFVYLFLFRTLHDVIFQDAYGALTRDLTVERQAFAIRLGGYVDLRRPARVVHDAVRLRAGPDCRRRSAERAGRTHGVGAIRPPQLRPRGGPVSAEWAGVRGAGGGLRGGGSRGTPLWPSYDRCPVTRRTLHSCAPLPETVVLCVGSGALPGRARPCGVHCRSSGRVAGLSGSGGDRQRRTDRHGTLTVIRPSLPQRTFKHARILIIDDEPGNVDLLRRVLGRAGFQKLDSTNDPREAATLYVQTRPDLILLDLHMPHMDGLAVMDQLNQIVEASYLPILMLTGDMTPEARRDALSRGAKDFVNKPFNPDEVLLRIGILLETRFLYLQIQSQNQMLEAKVRERTRELESAQIEIIERLARAAEFRDDNTGQHTERVGKMAARLARELGLPDGQVSLIRRAAPLHDVGKIGIPDAILLKLGKLTADRVRAGQDTHQHRREHPLGQPFALLRLAEEIAFSHHERWDGAGYAGLAGDEIPLVGRIVTVADVFDA